MKPMRAPVSAEHAACELAQSQFREFLEEFLALRDARSMEAHVNGCETCAQALEEYQRMFQLMGATIGAARLDERFDRGAEECLKRTPENIVLPQPGMARPVAPPPTGRAPHDGPTADQGMVVPDAFADDLDAPLPTFMDALRDKFGGAPWWVVSGAFHALLLLLLSLIGLAVMATQQDDIVIVTNLEQKKEIIEDKKVVERDVFKKPIPVESDMPVTDTQVVTHEEVEVADHVETEDEMDLESAKGDENAISDVPLSGVGTVAALGLGGGGGGAYGQRMGGGRRRLAMRNGGGKATESAVDKALEWLARHQEVDGRWDAVKYEGKDDPRVRGVNGNAAVTGFALLAFLGAGHTDRVGKYKDNVKRGLDWLIKCLDEQEKTQGHGRWVKNHGSNYTQGVAALALAEAAGMCRDPRIKDAAQRAVDGVVGGQIKIDQSEYLAWDYKPGGNTCDTSVTGWNIMALKAGKVAGLNIDPAAFEGAMNWVEVGQSMDGAKNGEGEYWEGGMMTYRGTPNNPHGRKNMAMTSAAALTRMWIAGQDATHPGVGGPSNLMRKPENLPTTNKSHFNLYYWYYGTLVMFQRGGDHWKEWNDSMKKVLVDSQRRDGDFDGSWDPYFTEPTGHIYGGRVQSTALGALSLEVYYRYLPILRK